MKLRYLSLLPLLALVPALPADVVYNYDGFNNSYSTNTTNPNLKLANGTSDFTTNSTRAFSTNAMHPGSNYTGPAFYGGYTVDTPSGNGFQYVRIESDQLVNNATGDLIRFTQNYTTAAINNECLFMGDLSAASAFDGTSSVTVRIVRDTGNMRLVLRSGGNYYVSDQSVALGNGNNFPAQTFNLATLTYSLYSPGTDLDYASNPSSYNPFNTAFDAAGVLINRTGTATTNTYLGQFTVDAEPAPTGTTYTVTPGVAPYPTIQSALNVALSAGDRVYVPAGTYRERVSFKADGITLEGAAGAIIDGSNAITPTWSQAPSPFVTGVYRTQITSFVPRTVTANGKWVLQLDKTKADDSPTSEPFWRDIFNNGAPDGSGWSGWDGMRALAMYDNATGEKWLYVRFKDNLNPSTLAMTISADSKCVTVNGFDDCTVRGLTMKNGTYGVHVTNSAGTVVEECVIGPIEYGVFLTTGADQCIVRHNEIFLDPYWGADPWREAAYDAWEVNKGQGWSNRYAVYIGNTLGGNEVHDNYLRDHWDGVNSNGNSSKLLGDKVHHNYLYRLFDNSIKASYNQADNEFHDNLIEVGRVGFRVSNPDAPGPLYVYRNLFIENKNDVRINSGSLLPDSEVWIYHNTSMSDTAIGVEWGSAPNSHTPNYHIVNNLFWCITAARDTSYAAVDWQADYNVYVKAAPGDRPFPAEWDSLNATQRQQKWDLGINQADDVIATNEDNTLWQATGLPGFTDSDGRDLSLISGGVARNRGQNLVGSGLPGVSSDTTPDAGALQYGEAMPVLPRP
jgi:hypothetical protein